MKKTIIVVCLISLACQSLVSAFTKPGKIVKSSTGKKVGFYGSKINRGNMGKAVLVPQIVSNNHPKTPVAINGRNPNGSHIAPLKPILKKNGRAKGRKGGRRVHFNENANQVIQPSVNQENEKNVTPQVDMQELGESIPWGKLACIVAPILLIIGYFLKNQAQR